MSHRGRLCDPHGRPRRSAQRRLD